MITKQRASLLWGLLAAYALGRICQLYADRLPTLLIVVLHVVPAAVFALAHGSVVYGPKGISAFAICCLGVGSLAESVSLRTGFPFGRYYFTEVMGPKIFGLPVLLALAYLGIGYVAWVLALLILGRTGKPLRGSQVVAAPLLASLIMTAWDLSMDPAWSTLDKAWIWLDGGAYFGVPVSNYVGWFLTAYVYYQSFALYCRANFLSSAKLHPGVWTTAILLYSTCALGNLLILKQPMAPLIVSDATGKQWLTSDLFGACVGVSLLVMAPFALLAWVASQQPRINTDEHG